MYRIACRETKNGVAARRRSSAEGLINSLRQLSSLVLIYTLVLPLAGAPATLAQTGPRPGQNDPVGNYEFPFPSHDVAAIAATNGGVTVQGWRLDQDLIPNGKFFSYGQPADADNIVAAAGRIWRPQDEQVVYARRPGGGSDLHVAFVADPPTSQASYIFNNFAPRFADSADFMDIAAGDLDRVTDSAGNFHDEVVVAYASPGIGNDLQNLTINLAVLDYTAPAEAPGPPIAMTTATTGAIVKFASSANDAANAFLPVDNVLSVATGDFDGDGVKEIALATLTLDSGGSDPEMIVQVYRYTNDGKNNRSLDPVFESTYVANPDDNSSFVGTIDLAVGNFSGLGGGDEVVMAGAEYSVRGQTVSQRVTFNWAKWNSNHVLQFYGNWSQDAAAVKGRPNGSPLRFDNLGGRVRMQVSPGLFKYDPANGYDLNRRQLVAAWNLGAAGDPEGQLAIMTFAIVPQNNENGSSYGPDLLNQLYFRAGPAEGRIYQRFSMTAGAFRGNTASPPPLWGIAVNYWGADGGTTTLAMLTGDVAFAANGNLGYPGSPGSGFQRFPVVAVDFQGKSVYLGPPVHFTLDNVINTDFVLHEPPKHAFYDNRPQIQGGNNQMIDNPTYGQVITVSRYDDTYVELKTKDSTSYKATSKDSSDWSIGGSVEVSAGETLTIGDAAVEGASVSVQDTAKIGYDYNQKKESYNSNYSNRDVTRTDTTRRDDQLLGRAQTFDIWRYRVYGIPAADGQGKPLNPFYEVVLPGPINPFDGGGLNFDGYQPRHENGNVLSYPQSADSSFLSDMGTHRIPCPSPPPQGETCNADGTLTVKEPLISNQLTYIDGNSSSIAYDYTNTRGSGNSFSYSHTLAESNDLKVSYKATASILVGSDQTTGSVDVNLHNSNSWGGMQTSDATATQGTGLTLQRSAIPSTQAYAFYPTFYTTLDGTIKVTHAVDVLGSQSGAPFWAGMYGRKADPALNLPSRFNPVSGPSGALIGWTPITGASRKAMRGIFFEKPDPNPVTNVYDLLASNPLAGDKVRIEARVYNYSTNTDLPVQNLKVRFLVIGVNQNTQFEIPFTSCPNNVTPDERGRCVIGETTVGTIEPLQMTTAAINWDTTVFGPAGVDGKTEYRVYVVLDPENEIDETYESENPNVYYPCVQGDGKTPCGPNWPRGLDPGQNNEGYGQIIIQHAKVSELPPAFDADVSMQKRSLAARNLRGRIRFNHIPAEINRPLSVRATVYSDKTHRGRSHLLVYDGDPEQGGRMIAAKLIHTGDQRGADVWFDWIPTSLGRHTLHARVLKGTDDPRPDNHTATLQVNVVAPDTTPPAIELTLTPDRLRPADGRFVPVRAFVSAKDGNDPHPDIRIESITHNEANDASGDVEGAEFGTDDRAFSLRAAREGRNDSRERVYEVVYSATDWAGNKSFAKAYVIVPNGVRR